MRSSRHSYVGWSPEKKLWEQLDRIGKNLQWRRVSLDSNYLSRVPRSSGVYVICTSPPFESVKAIGAHSVVYAGQVKSTNRGLQTRFREHIMNPSAHLKLYLDCFFPSIYFLFASVTDTDLIDKIEGFLIEAFNPPCNKIGAPGSSTLLARLGNPTIVGKD